MTSNIIDITSAKERFMGNFDLFARFLYQFPDRSLFGQLEEQIEAGDAAKAFETAHTIKGIAGNLSLKLMESPISGVVEPLRKGEIPSAEAWQELTRTYKLTVEEIQRLKVSGTKLF